MSCIGRFSDVYIGDAEVEDVCTFTEAVGCFSIYEVREKGLYIGRVLRIGNSKSYWLRCVFLRR